MKKILVLLFVVTTMAAYSQPPQPVTDLATVNTVKPKKGQKMAFEAAYKVHVAKFHKAEEKINVYEVLSGPNMGSYHLVNSESSYADFDKERPDAAAHNLDLDKNFFPYLEETMNGTYRLMDSLSLRPEIVGESFVVNVNHLKSTLNIGDYRRELSRAAKLYKTASIGPFFANLSFSYFEQLWDGSDQVTVTVRNLKDGFKSLAANYYGTVPAGVPSFRDAYQKEYGNTAWDDRVKLLEGAVEKNEQYIMKLRKDLSSQ